MNKSPFYYVVLVMLSVFSCTKGTKTSNPTPTPTATQLLVQHSWVTTSFEFGNAVGQLTSMPVNEFNPATSITFKADGTYTSGGDSGTWSLSGKQLVVNSALNGMLTTTVDELSATNLSLLLPAGTYMYIAADGTSQSYSYKELVLGN